jgi:hypothetical protein
MLCHWMNGFRYFEGTTICNVSETTHQRTQCHTPQDLNPQQHCCENHAPCKKESNGKLSNNKINTQFKTQNYIENRAK